MARLVHVYFVLFGMVSLASMVQAEPILPNESFSAFSSAAPFVDDVFAHKSRFHTLIGQSYFAGPLLSSGMKAAASFVTAARAFRSY